MGISDLKFKSGDFAGKDVSSLSDTPSADGMSAAMLKERFDMIPKMMVALGNFNSLIDLLSGASGASNISALDIIGNVTTIQGILDKLGINMSVDVNQNLNDIIKELETKETKIEVAKLLSSKADKSTTLAGYDIRDAYTKKQIDEIIGILDPDGVNDIIGDLSDLLTNYKRNVVGAINEVFISGSSWKTDIAAAITTKGVPTAPTETKETFVQNILAIESGGSKFMQIKTEQLTLYSVAKLTKVV